MAVYMRRSSVASSIPASGTERSDYASDVRLHTLTLRKNRLVHTFPYCRSALISNRVAMNRYLCEAD